ncbi:MAG: hypothetical protein F4066_00015 [Chloroflexi bacterium]|nr:hypothetical protein [Chloroflexota bacterium]MDE2707321.1 hypothetical protein [Chloroflexota bacterium]MYI03234.1 hypothetical protein [Chloroflexota bacterium]
MTVDTGDGYTVSSETGAASMGLSDNDEPTPEVNITASQGGCEGENVTFTLTAAPAPTSAHAPNSVRKS